MTVGSKSPAQGQKSAGSAKASRPNNTGSSGSSVKGCAFSDDTMDRIHALEKTAARHRGTATLQRKQADTSITPPSLSNGSEVLSELWELLSDIWGEFWVKLMFLVGIPIVGIAYVFGDDRIRDDIEMSVAHSLAGGALGVIFILVFLIYGILMNWLKR